jgi:hypothetical protein
VIEEKMMDDKEQQALVFEVERKIAMLLSDLEKRTGCYVDGLNVHNIEITNISSRSPEYLRRVEVDLRRQPGSRWET